MRDFFTDKTLRSNPFINWLELLAVILCLWFIMSEVFELKFIVFGVAACVVISLYCLNSLKFAGLKTDSTYFILHLNPFRFLTYLAWLLVEIVKSAIAVSGVVLTGSKKVDPEIIWFRADYDNPGARALLANSITLTPGTVTVDIYDDGTYSVHALNHAFAESLLEGTMQKKIARLYKEEIDYDVVKVRNSRQKSKKTEIKLLPKRYSARKRRI